MKIPFYREDSGMITPDESVLDLLSGTLQRFVAADAHIVHLNSVPLRGGMSGSAVWRHTIQYTTGVGAATIQLITKDADRQEWRVLQHLQSQQQPNIPFAHTIDTAHHERLLICLQDVGDHNRPTSLDPISETELAREATGLAAIHTANFQQHTRLDWLPSMSPTYVQDMLFTRAWRPAWETAVAHARFATTFRDAIPRVEAAAATIVDDMRALLREPASQTLIHADLNPSNVLVYNGYPYFIDWQTAMRGPFYIDLPHHHCTLTQAEHYRQALAAQGHDIARQDFAERYRVAARYIGFRYMWWTLDYWREDPTQTPWVQHYLNLVTGDGIGASRTMN
jgi:fructosamine-3-kinase